MSSIPSITGARAVFSLSVSAILAYALGFFALFILIKLYSQEELGAYAIFIAVLALVSPLSTLGTEYVLARERNFASSVAWASGATFLAGAVAFISSLSIFVVLCFGSQFSISDPMVFSLTLCVCTVATARAALLRFKAISMGAHVANARVQLIAMGARLVVQICFGYAGFTEAGLLIGEALARLLSLAVYTRCSVTLPLVLSCRVLRKSVKKFKADWRFIVLISASAYVSTATVYVVPLLLGGLLGAIVVAQFDLMFRLLSTPVSILGRAIADVFHTFLISGAGTRRSLKMTAFATMLLVGISSVPFGFCWLWGRLFLTTLLGEDWVVAGRLIEIYSPAYFAAFVASPLGRLFMMQAEPKAPLAVDVLLLGSVGVIFLFGYWHAWSVIEVAHLHAVAISLTSMIQVVAAFRSAATLDTDGR